MVTASVDILNQLKEPIRCRSLIDTCSTANFISEKLATVLGLPQKECSISVGTLNTLSTVSKTYIAATIRSRINAYQRTLTFLIVPTIAHLVPSQPIHRSAINIPKNIILADPDFYKPAPIDILLGAGTALSLLSIGQLNLSSPNSPDLFLQKTQLGWVIGGSVPSIETTPKKFCCFYSEALFDLQKFWELEEGPTIKHLTEEETACVEHFQRNLSRTLEGQYIVALPFNDKISLLGESRSMAYKRLMSIHRKLKLNPELCVQYHAVIQEYLDLGHMTPIPEENLTEPGYYLPHHAVLKESSLTTSVRVVFDASTKSTSGISLNDTLLAGPTIQSDLFSLLIRFRKHTFVVTGDIEKMYRQFLVRPEDRKYQRILWWNSKGVPQVYELNTVTFGLTSAPYLAIACLNQLANDEQCDFPEASRVLKEDSYVDDTLTGAETIEEAIQLRKQLTELLERGRLRIRQWASNNSEILKGLSNDNINRHLVLGDSTTIKTLGIQWNSNTDTILYTVKPPAELSTVTKRFVLSETAKIFDPLGLLAPVITFAKIFMQKLWMLKLDWDESLPASLHSQWIGFHNQLQMLNNLSFDRKVTVRKPVYAELHGFSDASERAYGACVYLRSVNANGLIYTALLCAKSRVAPIKTLTIPRLELCGALLLATLMSNVKEALKMELGQTIYWTDSTIVIHWLQTSPSLLKTFVANRVSEIQSKTDIKNWRHVRTHDNPADLVSRGQLPEEFIQSSFWNRGPTWLIQPENSWPVSTQLPVNENELELKEVQCFHLSTADSVDINLLNKFSSIQKLENIIAYCLRFRIHNKNKGAITIPELRTATQVIIRLVQKHAFPEEIHQLKRGQPISSHSRLLTLNVFLDQNGILRVGGRLRHANLPYEQRHPAVLPKGHHISQLLVEREHREHLHAGIRATLYALRKKYWLLNGCSEVRRILNGCITCRKLQPPAINYLMGDLPTARITQIRPFCRVGVDFCGPFFIKERKRRNRTKVKVYVAIFVCLVVKAVHIEVVSELSTDAFIAALKRFIGRRGKCSDIYSDNATNFVGANNELQELQTLLTDSEHQRNINHFATRQGFTWHFIPARSPNFGGLWEAAIKSFKHHLRRIMGNQLFTYEVFNTIVIEIEAVLNSRPLSPLSSDPNDFLVLTPGHFLIGDSLTSLPEQDLRDVPTNRLTCWRQLQQIRQHFWSRWSREYLNELTVRHKWNRGQPDIREGTLVLLKEDNLPPLQWVMGRVTKVHPGSDGICRVVTVKTARNTFVRSVKKIAPLLTPSEEETTTLST